MNKPEVIETKYSVRDGGHYVPGIKYNGVLYISGQLSIDPEIGKVPEGGSPGIEESAYSFKRSRLK